MSINLFETKKIQDFLNLLSGFPYEGGNPRAKEIIHRIVSDLFKTIDDLNITPNEFWSAVAYINRLGAAGEAGLLSPGLGFDHYLDLRLDAEDERLGITGGTQRTIEGPLYVSGAPVVEGFARMDEGLDQKGHTLLVTGTVFDSEGKPLPGAKVEVWHADTRGFYSHFDPTGELQAFCLRRSIMTDANGQYKYRTIVPAGYGCPPDSPTQELLNLLGRHGNRPAHIHYFVSADNHRKLTTQINIDNDPYLNDDFAYATREGLVPAITEVNDAARSQEAGIEGPFAEMTFDIHLTPLVNGEDNQLVDQRIRAIG